jgi:hypothetical protein
MNIIYCLFPGECNTNGALWKSRSILFYLQETKTNKKLIVVVAVLFFVMGIDFDPTSVPFWLVVLFSGSSVVLLVASRVYYVVYEGKLYYYIIFVSMTRMNE